MRGDCHLYTAPGQGCHIWLLFCKYHQQRRHGHEAIPQVDGNDSLDEGWLQKPCLAEDSLEGETEQIP